MQQIWVCYTIQEKWSAETVPCSYSWTLCSTSSTSADCRKIPSALVPTRKISQRKCIFVQVFVWSCLTLISSPIYISTLHIVINLSKQHWSHLLALGKCRSGKMHFRYIKQWYRSSDDKGMAAQKMAVVMAAQRMVVVMVAQRMVVIIIALTIIMELTLWQKWWQHPTKCILSVVM